MINFSIITHKDLLFFLASEVSLRSYCVCCEKYHENEMMIEQVWEYEWVYIWGKQHSETIRVNDFLCFAVQHEIKNTCRWFFDHFHFSLSLSLSISYSFIL
jgi:hypothetical protein